MKFEINFSLMKTARDCGHCLCDLSKLCPCNDFINEQKCKCGVFRRVD